LGQEDLTRGFGWCLGRGMVESRKLFEINWATLMNGILIYYCCCH